MSTLRVVVVGNGMVGHHYVETLATSVQPMTEFIYQKYLMAKSHQT